MGAAVADKMAAKNCGNLVIAIDPSLLTDPATFTARVTQVLDRVKAAERLPGVPEIFLPGERSAAAAAAVAARGTLTVEANLLRDLRAMAGEWAGESSEGNGSGAAVEAAPAAPRQWGLATRLVHPETGGTQTPTFPGG